MKFEIDTRDDLVTVLDPELIRPIDYLRPALGITTYLLCYLSMLAIGVSLLPLHFSVSFLIGSLAGGLSTLPVFIGAIGIYHYVWRKRLRENPEAFSQHISLDIPSTQAFELCLAAVSQLPKAKIEALDEEKKAIAVRSKGNFWITVDRVVLIKVESAKTGGSRITASSRIKLTRLREAFIKLVWGPRWYPIVFRVDINKNKKLLDQIAVYIRSIPNWDHSYSPAQLDVDSSAA